MSHIVAAAKHGMHVVIMAALHSKCGHYIFALRFHFYLFSSPILSHRRLDVYHTSTRGVALVQI